MIFWTKKAFLIEMKIKKYSELIRELDRNYCMILKSSKEKMILLETFL